MSPYSQIVIINFIYYCYWKNDGHNNKNYTQLQKKNRIIL